MQMADDKVTVVESSLLQCKKYLESVTDKEINDEMQKYSRLWNLQEFMHLEEKEIKSLLC